MRLIVRVRDAQLRSALTQVAERLNFEMVDAVEEPVDSENSSQGLLPGDVYLVEIAGGEDVLPKLRFQQAAKDRIILPDVVRAAAPDIILASWCGKKVVPDRIRQRPGWSDIPAVRDDRIIEIKSPLILQPGPAALTDGLDAIVKALWPGSPSS